MIVGDVFYIVGNVPLIVAVNFVVYTTLTHTHTDIDMENLFFLLLTIQLLFVM
jgi:hypothetical protein